MIRLEIAKRDALAADAALLHAIRRAVEAATSVRVAETRVREAQVSVRQLENARVGVASC